jgi:hypothetical protein
MDEELIDYLFASAQREGFKRKREDFVKYVQTDDELFDYLYGKSQREGYKRSKDHFAGLVGRGANQPVQEPVKTEAVAETVTTEPAKTETVTEESPMAAKEPISMPTKFSAREVSETVEPSKVDLTDKEKADRLKDVTEAKKDAMAEDMSSKLMPVTEKTKIKEVVEEKKKVEVPTDIKVKEVTQENSKLKIKDIKKVSASPLDVIKLKPNDYVVDIADKVPGMELKPSKSYKPYGKNGPDVYYSEDNDQYIIKNGDERILINKGSEKYEEITKKIEQSVGSTREGKGECGPANPASCSPTQNAIGDFVYWSGDDYNHGARTSFEGNLAAQLDKRKKYFENNGKSLWNAYEYDESQDTKTFGDLHYANEKLPKGDRFIIYKPYGDDKTLIYDKNSEIILKQLDQKAPMIDIGNIKLEGEDYRQAYQRYLKKNPNEGLNIWKAVELDHPEYKELKSLIDGVNYKKGKGNAFVPIEEESKKYSFPNAPKYNSIKL